MPATWITTKITHRQNWAPGLMTVRLEKSLVFKPGQFANLGLDINGERVRRSYSIASASGAPLEFFVTVVEQGVFTPPLFDLKVGDPILMEDRAVGLLTLDFMPDFVKDLWLLSTGTGLAPFMSMLRSGVLLPRFENVIVVSGGRKNEHLAYEPEFAELIEQHGGHFKYVGMVTREEPTGGHIKGRITDAIDDGRLEALTGVKFDPARSHFMLCGNPDMISQAMDQLIARGMKRNKKKDPGHISIEKYW
jgi:ferredoxin/flavodoxin---NADP+ reductase